MKTILPLFAFCLLLSNCFISCVSYVPGSTNQPYFRKFGNIDDPFLNTKKVILKHVLYSTEGFILNEITCLNVIYERLMQTDKDEKNTIYLSFVREHGSFPIHKNGFIKIGETTFPVESELIVPEHKIRTTNSTVSEDDITSSTVSTTISDYLKITLTEEMMALLRRNQKLTMRFYAGPLPATFEIMGNNALSLAIWLKGSDNKK